jgi:molybdopterin/thiamine biosynthesis adenylyltransferase
MKQTREEPPMTDDWKSRIESSAEERGPFRVVPWHLCREVAASAGLSAREVERWACENGLVPSRYERSIGTLGLAGQARLLDSTAAVVGCGGLGGLVVELLARAGVGRLVLVDGDTFSDHNLNRQLLCDESNLGQSKAIAAARRAAAVNGAVETRVAEAFLEEANALSILSGCDLAVDALDSNGARRTLRNACLELGIPMVHGAIAGFWGQVGVFLPEDATPWDGPDGSLPDRGIELETGNPPFTPAFIAALESAEAVKILAGVSKPLRHRLLWADLDRGEFHKLRL